MATPTPGKTSSAQVVATPPVSTPFSTSNHHPAFSPHGPRSVVPSPQQVKKSPANSNTLYGYPSGGGHPTSSSFGIGYDSPSAAMALGGIPTPSGTGVGDLGIYAGMGGSMGLGSGRADEDERRRKLEKVVDILSHNKGRLSEAGITRLARRVGLDAIKEGNPPDYALILATLAMSIDIVIVENNLVKKVTVAFPDAPDIVTRHNDKAGDVLLKDLQFGSNEGPTTKMLDRFAANLERLVALDKLSIMPGLSCNEAVSGIYESLERLHLWEVDRLKEQADMGGKNTAYIERMAMCTKSGKPVMHTRGRLGLSLDYWQQKWRVTSKEVKAEQKTWSLLLECAPVPPLVSFPPIRVSTQWISPHIRKEPPGDDIMFLEELDWLEPSNILLSPDHTKGDPMQGIEGSSARIPEVMFVAKFDPPVIVTGPQAAHINASTNTQFDPYQATTFDGLMFPQSPTEPMENNRTIRTETTVRIFSSNGEKSSRIHKNTLFIEEIEFGRTLTELPFSHPRQLVEMLPILRQYAFISTILLKTFGPDTKPLSHTPSKPSAPPKSKRSAFADFMSSSTTSESAQKELKLDITLNLASQPPSLRMVFPFRKETANITFMINLNGVVEVKAKEQNILPENGCASGLKIEDLGRMLEVCEDLGIWAEFVRRRLG